MLDPEVPQQVKDVTGTDLGLPDPGEKASSQPLLPTLQPEYTISVKQGSPGSSAMPMACVPTLPAPTSRPHRSQPLTPASSQETLRTPSESLPNALAPSPHRTWALTQGAVIHQFCCLHQPLPSVSVGFL